MARFGSRRDSRIALAVLAAGAVGMIVFNASGLAEFFSQDYVPTAEMVLNREHLKPFLVDASGIEGIYGNMDVNGSVFRYRTGVRDAESFLQRIEQQREGTAWTRLPDEGDVRRFQRIEPKRDKMFCSVEELRLKHSADGNVVVGFVVGDSLKDVDSLEECGVAPRFAKSEIWPRLKKQ